EIILKRPFGFMKFGACAGIIIAWPDSSKLASLLITISAFPSMIWTKVSNGEVFSVNPSPLSKDMMLILPVDFLMIVFITTEFAIYSMISTMICDFDFSSSEVSGFPSLFFLFIMLLFTCITSKSLFALLNAAIQRLISFINDCYITPRISYIIHTYFTWYHFVPAS